MSFSTEYIISVLIKTNISYCSVDITILAWFYSLQCEHRNVIHEGMMPVIFCSCKLEVRVGSSLYHDHEIP